MIRPGKVRELRPGEKRPPVRLTFDRVEVRDGTCSLCAFKIDNGVRLNAVGGRSFFLACFDCIRGLVNAAIGDGA